MAVVGINSVQLSAATDLFAYCDAQFPACGCAGSPYPVAEDGRYLLSGEPVVACVDGMCRTSVVEIPCGDALSCGTGEVCRVETMSLGPTQQINYSCVPDPCGGATLNCECAQSTCQDINFSLCQVGDPASGQVLCDAGTQ
jgi:hypothetical protein